MLVKIPNGPTLRPEHVVSIARDFYDRNLIITDINGTKHEVSPVWHQSIYECERNVVLMLNVEKPQTEKPLTASDLADALGCFWNAALGEAQQQQEGFAIASIVATGFAAVQNRLIEIAERAEND